MGRSDFDDLIGKFVHDPTQVSHGLNLVLRLKSRWAMPKLLLEIVNRQSQLDAALRELNFVHFARFLPSPDGSALLVITEFDGDLETYAMDFAVAIGEIFTAILRFVEHAPPLPVWENPDEFWDFIKRNNRVRILGLSLPEKTDYPLFSAYREKTVLDIVGHRKEPLMPVSDRPGADIDLADVQGNLLENYHARFAHHFILQVTDAPRARSWLANLARGSGGGMPRVTTAASCAGLATMLNVGLTYRGLLALGLRPSLLARFPQAFQEGPGNATRAAANGDVEDSAPACWILGAPGGNEHVMLTIHARKHGKPRLDEECRVFRDALADLHQSGMVIRSEHEAAALRGGREHFGFRDGIAQPRLAHRHDDPRDMQPAASPGEFLLGANYKDVFGGPSIGKLPPKLATNGTFCAVRVLEQHVDSFRKMLESNADRLGVSRELLAAKLMGRWFDGQPLALYPNEAARDAAPDDAAYSNEFDYEPSHEYPNTPPDPGGLHCPIGAHIRRANPRTSRRAGVRYTRRLIRRGMTYEWQRGGPGGNEKGIFGLFYCGSLERQFEFVQQNWVNGGLFTSGVRGTKDPICGAQAASGGAFSLPGMGKDGGPETIEVPRLTRTRGSLYLFMPGITALASLDAPELVASTPEPATVQTGSDMTAQNRSKLASVAAGAGWLQKEVFGAGGPISSSAGTGASAPAPADAAAAWSPEATAAAQFHASRFDPEDRAFLSNPYPTYAAFRKYAPVHYVPQYDAFWVFRHDLVEQLCADSVRFLKQWPASLRPRGIFTMDPPRHGQVRRILEQAFWMAIAHAQPIARRAVDRALRDIHGSSFDLVEQFARRVPREVFFEIAGINGERQAQIDRLARTLLMSSDRTLHWFQRLGKLTAGPRLAWLLLRMIPEALLSGTRGTLFYEVARQTAPLPGARLKATEAVMTLLQFVLGGYLSTEFLLATGTRNLLLADRRPWKLLQQEPDRLADALHEMRRFDTPLGVIDRWAATDLRFGGIDIPFGARLMGMLGSANRDVTAFGPDADHFDITRGRTGASVALGRGIHECIGKPLQEIVASQALPALMQRFPNLRLASPAQPPWFTDPYFRSFSRLTVCT